MRYNCNDDYMALENSTVPVFKLIGFIGLKCLKFWLLQNKFRKNSCDVLEKIQAWNDYGYWIILTEV